MLTFDAAVFLVCPDPGESGFQIDNIDRTVFGTKTTSYAYPTPDFKL
jgi:hypothetical protein